VMSIDELVAHNNLRYFLSNNFIILTIVDEYTRNEQWLRQAQGKCIDGHLTTVL
jgi:hypothetical protein